MPAYNFQPYFVRAILSGEKCGTIRRRAATAGDTAHLFTGQRTKHCSKLGTAEIVHCAPIALGYDNKNLSFIKLSDQQLSAEQMFQLARDDGFANAFEMRCWFKNIYPRQYAKPDVLTDGGRVFFKGFLITWGPLK